MRAQTVTYEFTVRIEVHMAAYEDDRLAMSARYIVSSRELEITLDDGSRHLIPVDRLEMVESTSDAYVPMLDRPISS